MTAVSQSDMTADQSSTRRSITNNDSKSHSQLSDRHLADEKISNYFSHYIKNRCGVFCQEFPNLYGDKSWEKKRTFLNL